MPGAMTMAYDIIENEKEAGLVFDHIFIDTGSGTSAIGLLLGLRLIQKKCAVHITLIAGTEADFIANYNKMATHFEGYTGIKLLPETLFSLRFYKPVVSPSFGSVTHTILNEAKSIARNEGILMDPVYSIKHLMTVKQILKDQQLSGNMLFIYCGGSFGLAGFQGILAEMAL